MAFSHAGELREPCRTISAEELANLPANTRKLQESRERSPIVMKDRWTDIRYTKVSFLQMMVV